jgi:hypothetical protein
MYRGLSPHKIMPMPGTHKAAKPDGFAAACLGRYALKNKASAFGEKT